MVLCYLLSSSKKYIRRWAVRERQESQQTVYYAATGTCRQVSLDEFLKEKEELWTNGQIDYYRGNGIVIVESSRNLQLRLTLKGGISDKSTFRNY